MWLLFFFGGGSISRAVQCFALFNHQQLSLHEELCQLCVTEVSRKQKNLPELLLVLAGNCSLRGSCTGAFLLQSGTTVPKEPG